MRRVAAAPIPGPPPECYLKYFLDKIPPQGLLVPVSPHLICQTVPDYEDPKKDFFATLFDKDAGIAIFTAYLVTKEQAKGIGDHKREELKNLNWRITPGVLTTLVSGSRHDLILEIHISVDR